MSTKIRKVLTEKFYIDDMEEELYGIRSSVREAQELNTVIRTEITDIPRDVNKLCLKLDKLLTEAEDITYELQDFIR